MITEDLLIEHDKLEKKATPRPWFSIIRTSGIYKTLQFWSRTPYREIAFDSFDDIKYLTLIRNIAPNLVAKIREQREALNSSIKRENQLRVYCEELLIEIEVLKKDQIARDAKE